MSDIVHGEDVIVEKLIDGVYYEIGCGTNCSFRFKNEIIYKTTINSGGFREKRVRISDVSGSVTGLIKTGQADNVLSILGFLPPAVSREEGTYKFTFTDQDGVDKTITMTAVIDTIDLRGPVESFADFDLNIEGTGAIDFDEVGPPSASDIALDSDTWTIGGGNNYIEDARLENVTPILVTHEGTQFDKTLGSPGNREYKYTASIGGKGRIEVDANIVMDGQKIFVVWIS